MLNTKPQYRPNVSQYLALCGRNYHALLRWLPVEADIGDTWSVSRGSVQLEAQLFENTKYTQLIEIRRSFPANNYIKQPKVLVRLYHDAQLAEVLSSQQIYQLLPVYDYPNPKMHQTNEKYQMNAFLSELLILGCQTAIEDE
ncbi:DUF1249 domain-containing protein [Parashewanella curva]|uniref:DUF1249 domain-containing protein n=1 Tax=Parashewanella curva TaxID=2338552 RepID=A0A3L8Q191_9GAMM|nr:DUF1249 domain-containing protein [Parashewanella curva]RLV60483.1 DUF1249 domain-containing protein [Parashewanella curva]